MSKILEYKLIQIIIMITIPDDYNYGRFGNKFLRNMAVYLVCQKSADTISAEYQDDPDFEKIGIIFKSSTTECNNADSRPTRKQLNDLRIERLLNTGQTLRPANHYQLKFTYCQLPSIVQHIVDYYQNPANSFCESIIKNNKYAERYSNNTDVFIHVRAGDIFEGNPPTIPGIEFYLNVLNLLRSRHNLETVWLSSDNLSDPLCQQLLDHHNVTAFDHSASDTILFGSSCRYIVMSAGSFSFMIGLLAFYSDDVYFSPEAGSLQKERWHPDYYPTLLKYSKYKVT